MKQKDAFMTHAEWLTDAKQQVSDPVTGAKASLLEL
jgi:hypothetical protein